MQIDINYARAYIYYLLITKMPNKKYQTVSKKTLDIIINEIKERIERQGTISIELLNNESIENNFNQVFYSDDEDIILKKNPNPGSIDLSILLICSRTKATKDGDISDVTRFDTLVANYFNSNQEFINSLVEYDNNKTIKEIERLIAYYRYIQDAYKQYYMSNEPIMHQRYKIAEIVKKRNKLLEKLSQDSVVFKAFQNAHSNDCSFLDDDFCIKRIKEDSFIYNIKNNSRNGSGRQISKPEFLLYVDNIQQKKYHDNIKEVLTGGMLDDYPNEKKYIEIQSIANSIISETSFFYKNEQWLEQGKIADCNLINPIVIYEIWKKALAHEIKSILAISDDEYRNNSSLFAKKLNSTMIIKSFADLSPNIFEKINQYLSEVPQFYHSSHMIGKSLLSEFSSLGGKYDKSIKKMIAKN